MSIKQVFTKFDLDVERALSKKVIICDVDDTICQSTKIISQDMANEINRLLSKKIIFVFISGSTAQQIHGQISNSLFFRHHLLGSTGTHYMIVDHGIKDIYNFHFSILEREEIMNAFNKLIEDFNIESMTTKEDQLQDRRAQITLSAIGRGAPSEMKKSYDPDMSKRKLWVEYLKGILGDKYSINIGGTTSIDITIKGMNKRYGVENFLKLNSIEKDDCIFYGDNLQPGGNDFPVVGLIDTISVTSWEDTLEHFRKL